MWVSCIASHSFGPPESRLVQGISDSQILNPQWMVAEYHQDVSCLSLRQFRRHILPASLPDAEITAILGAIDIKALKRVVEDERREVHEGQPSDKSDQDEFTPEQANQTKDIEKAEDALEMRFFKHIATIYEHVASAGRKVFAREEISKIHYDPRRAPTSLERRNPSVSDCNLVLSASTSCKNDADKNVYLCDVFATCAFKKGDNLMEIYENHTQLIWDMRHIMREDPCRRFVFGISIENKQARIWQANRADIFVSDPFDYIDKLEDFLGVLAQLIFANKTDLGWDDSIIRIEPGVYKIRVGERWYKTDKVLSNLAADDLTGHASRVWLATLVDETERGGAKKANADASQTVDKSEGEGAERKAKQVAIKDSWPVLNTIAEHEVQALLLSTVPEDMFKMLKERLFTISSYEKIQIDEKEDNTLDTISRGLETANLERLQIRRPMKRETLLLSATSKPSGSWARTTYFMPPLGNRKPREIRHRYHYRMVMEEVATPVWQIDDLEHALTAYRDSLIVISILSYCGWVHRDISSGNVYFYNGRGIVGDFEYAKPIEYGKRFDARTGTRDFMALEVAFHQHLFRRIKKEEKQGSRTVQKVETPEFLARLAIATTATLPDNSCANSQDSDEESDQHFFHNNLHDVESTWWGCIRLLFKSRIECDAFPDLLEVYKGLYTDLKDAASQIFPEDPTGAFRLQFLNDTRYHKETMARLPSALKEISDILSAMGEKLVSSYLEVEQTRDDSINGEPYGPFKIVEFVSVLTQTIPLARGMELKEFPTEWDPSPTPAVKEEQNGDQQIGSKRQSSESTVNLRTSKRHRGKSDSNA